MSDLSVEFLAKRSNLYCVYHRLLEQKIDCSLFYNDADLYIKFESYPNLMLFADDKNDTITDVAGNRNIPNLTCDKALERVLNYIGGKNDNDRPRQTPIRVTD